MHLLINQVSTGRTLGNLCVCVVRVVCVWSVSGVHVVVCVCWGVCVCCLCVCVCVCVQGRRKHSGWSGV